jgi:hypothetical protein
MLLLYRFAEPEVDVTEVVVVSVERKDPRAGLWVESLLVELGDGLERMRPRVCKNMSASSSER